MKRKSVILAGALAALLLLGFGIFYLGQQGEGVPVPVLMYHHFIDQGPAQVDTVVSADRFEEQIRALKEAGYTAVTPAQLIAFARDGAQLPDKPILITMDDGYTSNLTIAAPILEQYGMTATVFTIGLNVGQTHYAHSGEVLDPPRFGWEEARPWVEKGVMVVQSHTYDLHQRASYGYSGREGVLSLEGETEEEYRAVLAQDFTKARDQLQEGLGVEMEALAFPFGFHSDQAVEELEKLGVSLTVTTVTGCSAAASGRPESIQRMKRLNVTDTMTGAQLVESLARLERGAALEIS